MEIVLPDIAAPLALAAWESRAPTVVTPLDTPTMLHELPFQIKLALAPGAKTEPRMVKLCVLVELLAM
jgi:hypothetical protein